MSSFQSEPVAAHDADGSLSLLREVVTTLAPLEKRAGSAGEREAAEWLARQLTAAGALARVEDVEFRDGYARQLLPLGAAGTLMGALALSGRARVPAVVVGALAAAAIADDADNRLRVWRRLVTRPRTTTNVVAHAGDPDAERTLVVLAHHDAAPTGRIFDQSLQRPWLAAARADPAREHLAAALVADHRRARRGRARRRDRASWTARGRHRRLAGHGRAGRRRRPQPDRPRRQRQPLRRRGARGPGGASEGRARPGLRVILASCGAEEVLQGGIYAFVDDHLRSLDPSRTWVLNLDTVGSPQLVMVEGEGVLLRIEDYADPSFRDDVAAAAEQANVPLVRGQRARSSTDGVIPSRAGYPTALLTSFEPDTKLLSNYHLPSDTPENLDYGTVAEALTVTETLARRLARAA